MPIRTLLAAMALALAALVAIVACGGDDDADAGGAITGDVVVFAAASLRDAFTEIADAFEDAHPRSEVVLSFAASSELARQLAEGAPADVFASADEASMAKVEEAGGIAGEAQVFATNALQIIVERGNPQDITGLESLADPDLVVVTGAPEVPIGRYTREVLDRAGVTVEPDSYEQNVRGIVSKVVLGEADAGIVYASDVRAAGDDAEGVEIPADVNVTARYPIGASAEARNEAGAEAFVELVLGDAGQAVLDRHGFGAP